MFLAFESTTFFHLAYRMIKPYGSIGLATNTQCQYTSLCEANPLPGKEDEFDRAVYRLLFLEQAIVPRELNDPRWLKLANRFHPNGATLTTVSREFLHWNRDLEDPFFAAGRCYTTSHRFESLLLKRGAVSHDDLTQGRVAIEEIDCDGIFFHACNRVGNIHIDWTFRQFKPDSPFPFIFHERQMPDAWKEWRKIIDQRASDMGF